MKVELFSFSPVDAANLDARIEERRGEDIARVFRGELISLPDITSFLGLLPAGARFRLITQWEGKVVPALCMGIRSIQRPPGKDLKSVRAPSLARRQYHYDAMLRSRGVKWRNTSVLLISNAPSEFELYRTRIQTHVITLIIHTQLWRNLHKDLSKQVQADIQSDFMNIEAVIERAASRIGCRYAIVEAAYDRHRDAVGNTRVKRGFRLSRAHAADRDAWTDFLDTAGSHQRRFVDAAQEAIATAKLIDLSDSFQGTGRLSGVTSALLFPVAKTSDVRASRTQAVVMYYHHSASRRFNWSDISLTQDLIGVFLDQQGQGRRAELLHELTQASRETELKTDGGINLFLERAYLPTMNTLCGRLLLVTQAHSATIRLVDYGSATLAPVAWHQSNVNPDESPWSQPKPISLGRRYTSSIVYAFLNEATYTEGVYLRNVRDIPQSLRDAGLKSVIVNKEETASSIQIPFFLNKMPIGIINLESRYLDAFADAIGFLSNVAQHLSSFLSELQSRYDAQFIADRVSYLGHVHDLENLQQQLTKKDAVLAVRLREIIGIMRNDDDPTALDREEVSLRRLVVEAAEFRCALGSELLEPAIASFQIDDQEQRVLASQRMKRALRFIIDNFLSNIVQHRRTLQTTCKITLSSRVPEDSGETSRPATLGFEYVIRSPVSDKVAQSLGARPIMDSERGLRLGLYTVGLVTRILGGYTTAGKAGEVTVMAVRIPVQITREGA